MNNSNLKEEYWKFITNIVLTELSNCDDYEIEDFKIMKLNLMYNLHTMFESEDKFNEAINVLKKEIK